MKSLLVRMGLLFTFLFISPSVFGVTKTGTTVKKAKPLTVLKSTDKLQGQFGGYHGWDRWNYIMTSPQHLLYGRVGNDATNVLVNQRKGLFHLGIYMEANGAGDDQHPLQERFITVPADVAAVVALIDTEWDKVPTENGFAMPKDEADARKMAAKLQRDVITQVGWVDGIPVSPNVLYTQHVSPTPWQKFSKPPENNFWQVNGALHTVGKQFPAVTQGPYIMIPQLTAGEHTIRIHAKDMSGFNYGVIEHVTADPNLKRATHGRNKIRKDPPPPPADATIVGLGKYADHTLGVTYYLESSAHRNSSGGMAITPEEYSRALVLALIDSKQRGQLDPEQKDAFRRVYDALPKSDKESADVAQWHSVAVLGGKDVDTLTHAKLAKQLATTATPNGTDGDTVTGEELNKIIALMLVDKKSPGRIDADEALILNNFFAGKGPLPVVNLGLSTGPRIPPKLDWEAEYIRDSLRYKKII